MTHARVLAGLGAAECGLVAYSLTTRDFMATQFLPGRSAVAWGCAFAFAALLLVIAAVVADRIVHLLRGALLIACGLHAAFAGVFWVYAISQNTSLVGATFAAFVAAVYAREVLRLGGYPW